VCRSLTAGLLPHLRSLWLSWLGGCVDDTGKRACRSLAAGALPCLRSLWLRWLDIPQSALRADSFPQPQSSSLALPCQILVSVDILRVALPFGQVATGHTLPYVIPLRRGAELVGWLR